MVNKKEDRLDDLLAKCRGFLRGKLDFVENRNAVLMLVFLKFAQDKFIKRQHEIIMEFGVEALDNIELYEKENVLYLDSNSTWSYIVQNSGSDDIAKFMDMALAAIEKNNKTLEGVFVPKFFSSLNIEPVKLRVFIECVDSITDVVSGSDDIIGRVYEFFIKHYAMDERKIRGEYFTPKSVVELMVELIEPFENSVYDPCFGTGGLFIQSAKLSQRVRRNGNLKLYGQEINREMWRLAKLNLAIQGINADLGQKCVSVFSEDIHAGIKMDYILANPPFNLRSWEVEINFEKDERFLGYDLTKCANANYCWILHILSKLSENGVAGIILSNSPLNSEEDFSVRKSLIEQDKIEAIIVFPREMFYSTDISVSLWIFNNNKKERQLKSKSLKDRSNKVLFIDLRSWTQVRSEGNFVCFEEEQIQRVKEIFDLWRFEYQKSEYFDIPELCKIVSIDDIRKQNYNLIPSKYIDFEHKKFEMNFDEEITDLILELEGIKKEEDESFKRLTNVIKSLGYEI